MERERSRDVAAEGGRQGGDRHGALNLVADRTRVRRNLQRPSLPGAHARPSEQQMLDPLRRFLIRAHALEAGMARECNELLLSSRAP